MFQIKSKKYFGYKLALFLALGVVAPMPAAQAQDSQLPISDAEEFRENVLDFLTGEGEQGFPVAPEVADEAIPGVNMPLPDEEILADPAIPVEADDTSIMGVPEIVLPADDENLFFDSDDLVPDTEMGQKAGPRIVNPEREPGSKLILVRKNAGTNSHDAQLVAAQRALKLGRHDAALEMYNRLAERRSRDPNVLLGQATSLQKLGRTQEAIMAYQELIDIQPSLDAEINMLGLMSGQYPAVALQRLLELREAHPSNPGVVAQIAVVQTALGRYNEALQFLGIATSMEPQNARHLFNIGIVADKAGNKKEALRYYQQALEIDTIYGGGRSIPREIVYERLAQIR